MRKHLFQSPSMICISIIIAQLHITIYYKPLCAASIFCSLHLSLTCGYSLCCSSYMPLLPSYSNLFRDLKDIVPFVRLPVSFIKAMILCSWIIYYHLSLPNLYSRLKKENKDDKPFSPSPRLEPGCSGHQVTSLPMSYLTFLIIGYNIYNRLKIMH